MLGTVVAMTDTPAPRSYHKLIIFGLVLLNLAAVAYAVYEGAPGMRDYYLRDGSYITWLFAGQMFSAALLFVACFFAQNIVPMEELRRKDTYGWLVFAAGFLLLALDQVFRLREHLTLAMTGAQWSEGPEAATFNLVKIVVVAVAIILVFIFRKVVLANFRMVLALVAGFWFLLMMLIVDMLFESIGVSSQTVGIMEGAAKLLAMAMFTAAPFVALLDRLHDARVLVHTSRRMVLLRDIHSVREVPEEHERWDDRTEEPPPPEAREEEETAEDDAGPPPPDEVEPVEQEEAKVEKVSEEEKGEPPAEEEKPAEEKPAEEKPAEEKPAEEAEPSKPAEEEKPTK
jgi:hypothetical protein